jgi:hypothetical protein
MKPFPCKPEPLQEELLRVLAAADRHPSSSAIASYEAAFSKTNGDN